MERQCQICTAPIQEGEGLYCKPCNKLLFTTGVAMNNTPLLITLLALEGNLDNAVCQGTGNITVEQFLMSTIRTAIEIVQGE